MRTLTASNIDELARLGFTSLRALELGRRASYVVLKDDGIEALARTGWPLATLDAELSPRAVTALASVVAAGAFPQLFELDLANGALDDDEIAPLAEAEHLGALRRLSLHGNAITATGARALMKAPWLGQLESLDITGNDLGSAAEELRALFESLPGSRELGIDS